MSQPPAPEDELGDADLVRRLTGGDVDALAVLYDRYSRYCFALARQLIADDRFAEDVVQDVFVMLWRDPAGFDAGGHDIADWLLVRAHHTAVDAVRREETLRRHRDPSGEPAGQAAADLRALPPMQRRPIALAYFGGYTQWEIAALTGVPVGTVKSHMLLGVRRLGRHEVSRSGPHAGTAEAPGERCDLEALAAGWTLHSLEPNDEELFAGHVPGCRRCQRVVSETGTTVARIARAVPAEAPSKRLREGVLSAAAEIPQDVGTPPVEQVPTIVPGAGAAKPPGDVWSGSGSWFAAGRRPVLLAGIAVLSLAIAMGVWNVVLRNDRDSNATLAAHYRQAILELTSPGAGQAALDTPSGKEVATVVVNAAQISVISLALPDNDPTRSTYVLWGLTSAHATPVEVGTFDVEGPAVDRRTVRVGSNRTDYPTYAVSRESGRSAPARPTSLIASGDVAT